MTRHILDWLPWAGAFAVFAIVTFLARRDARRLEREHHHAALNRRHRPGLTMPALDMTAPWPRDCGCFLWDARGDRPVPVWCADHCPDCDKFCPCVVHDEALWAELERRAQ